MTRPTVTLQQHLLTRSDLARLEVPAAVILSWLANGWLEQVGRIPDDEVHGDPVFTVLSGDLRQELAKRLRAIGKPAVVLTPLRVRSFLMRAMIGGSQPAPAADQALEGPTTGSIAENLQDADLVRVLHDVAADLEADVDAMLRLAKEEASLEAAADRAARSEEDGRPPAAEASDLAAAEDEAGADAVDWFDPDDLASALDGWEETDLATPTDEAAATSEPSDEPMQPAASEPSHQPSATEASGDGIAAFLDGLSALDAWADQGNASATDAASFDSSFGSDADDGPDLRPFVTASAETGLHGKPSPTSNAKFDESAARPAEVTAAAAPTMEPPASLDQGSDTPEIRPEGHGPDGVPSSTMGDGSGLSTILDELGALDAWAQPTGTPPSPAADADPSSCAPSVEEGGASAPAETEPTMDSQPDGATDTSTANLDALAAQPAPVTDAASTTTESVGEPSGEPALMVAADASPHSLPSELPAQCVAVEEEGLVPASQQDSGAGEGTAEVVPQAEPGVTPPPGPADGFPGGDPGLGGESAPAPTKHAELEEALFAEMQPSEPAWTNRTETGANTFPTHDEAATVAPIDPLPTSMAATNELASETSVVPVDEAAHLPSATPPMPARPETEAVDAVEAAAVPAAGEPDATRIPANESVAKLVPTTVSTNPAIAANNTVTGPDITAMAIERVDAFLSDLKGALIEMAQRPAPSTLDVQPLVAAVQTGLERAREQSNSTQSALQSLGDKWDLLGQRMENGLAQAMRTARDAPDPASKPPASSSFVATANGRGSMLLLAVLCLALCWSVLFWFKTGSPKLALGTLVTANILGCSVLFVRSR